MDSLAGKYTITILIIYVHWKFPGQIKTLLLAFSTVREPIEKQQNN